MAGARGRLGDGKTKVLNFAIWAVVVALAWIIMVRFADKPAWEYWKQIELPSDLDDMFEFFGLFISPAAVILLVWTCLVSGSEKSSPGRMILQLVLAGVFVFLVVYLLKYGIPRIRPRDFPGGNWLASFTKVPAELLKVNEKRAFPSGDSAFAFALAGVVAWHFERYRVILFTLAVGCAISRFAVNAHWLSDVFAGCVIGLIISRLVIMLTTESKPGR